MAIELQSQRRPYRDSDIASVPKAQYPDRKKIGRIVGADREIFKVESGSISTSTEQTMRNGCITLAALAVLGALGTALAVGLGMSTSFAGGLMMAGAIGLLAIGVKLAVHAYSTHSKIAEKRASENQAKEVFNDAAQLRIGQIIGDVNGRLRGRDRDLDGHVSDEDLYSRGASRYEERRMSDFDY